MSIISFFRGLFGSSEKSIEVSSPAIEKLTSKDIDVEMAKLEIEKRLKEISEEKKSNEKKVTAKEIKAKVKKPEIKAEQPAKATQPKAQPAKQTEKKVENKPRPTRKKTDK